MSVIPPPFPAHLPQLPLLSAFFTRMYQNDVEWAASAFWQVLCQVVFRPEEGFAAVYHQPPDEGRDSVDILPYAYDPSDPSLLRKRAMLEIKRAGNSREKLIKQTERYALKARNQYSEPFMLAMSIHCSEFKAWVLMAGQDHLQPFFPYCDRFIPVHSPEGVLFFNFVDAIKDPTNLQSYRQISDALLGVSALTYPASSSAQIQPQQEQEQEQEQQPQPPGQGAQEEEGAEDEVTEVPEEDRRGTKVRIHTEEHRFSADKYYFKDTGKRVCYTTAADWRKEGHNYYRYKHNERYWCSKRPRA
ncbi:hypothetical protein CDV36_016173 [Fusarium kuroshium]|uniref:Uncharacterized protein n=1 Tax=Fusarium kuroshium TaxID=2010991 RepID=A0A3M2QY41_9HYPO|nr:hypothetical protein CDV36_016173 [Fusarium kuroshium]